MKNLCLIVSIFIVFSCNSKKDKINLSQSKEQLEINTDNSLESKNNIPKNEKIAKIREDEMISRDSTSIANIALNFINGYTEKYNQIDNRIELTEWIDSNKNVSQNFKDELKKIIDEANKADPEYGLGFDPIFNAQDYPNKGFKLIDFDTILGIVNVKDKILENGFRMKIKLIKENNKWLINGCGIINMPEVNWIEK
ncbi:hypothetical protein GSB9_00010 [Flavobacteriaceae bacterium GSB9]|nr:hypothetical protein GSB9_00010 [Flavobacteriaceae bacterium GSB9]